MRLIELRRTTSFRLALLFLLLFGAASLALFGFLFCQTRGYLVGRVDNWLAREQNTYLALDKDDRLEHLAAHVTGDPALERPFTLFDPAGHRIAGSILSVPPALLANMPQDRPCDFTVRRGDENVWYRGLAHRMPTSGNLLLIAEDMSGATEFVDVLVNSFLWGGLVTALLGLAGAAMTGLCGGPPHRRGDARDPADRERRSIWPFADAGPHQRFRSPDPRDQLHAQRDRAPHARSEGCLR